MTWQIRNIQASDTYPLRSLVLRPNLLPDQCGFDTDLGAKHFGLFTPELAAVASLCPIKNEEFKDQNQWRLRGMAVAPNWQRQGLGASIVKHIKQWALENGRPLVWCFARKHAADFYLKMGFFQNQELVEIEGVGPHYLMWVKV